MNKDRLLSALGVVLTLVLVISACKSAPPAVTKPEEPVAVAPVASVQPAPPVQSVQPEPVVVAKPVDEALTALRDKTEALRNEGLKYGLNAYRADDWSAAETVRAAATAAYGKDYDAAQASFTDAISRYQKIRKESFASIAAELEAAIKTVRAEAVRVGAPGYYPEQFSLADAAVDKAVSLRDADDLAGSYDIAQVALMRYKSLVLGIRAVELKTKADRNDFAKYDGTDYAQAGAKYDEATASYGTADAAALESVTSSVTLYESVNNAGFKVLAENLSAKVEDVRMLCDSIKAAKAAKVKYAEADTIYKAAYAYGAAGHWESAYNAGNDALDAFSSIYQDVLLRKNAADAAIASAKAKQDTSTGLALKADALAPLAPDATGYSEDIPTVEESAPTEETK
jgi:hypothetical protein